MSGSIYRRLQQALPDIRAWIEWFVADHAASVVPLSELAEAPLRRCFPVELLAGINVVVLPRVTFPPVGSFGLPEFAEMEQMPLEGITFDTTFFVQAGAQSQSLYFHEIVHVVQWQHLGFDRFLLAYAANMIGRSYVNNPLEAIAYSMQAEFENGTVIDGLISQIQSAADSTWSDVEKHFASRIDVSPPRHSQMPIMPGETSKSNISLERLQLCQEIASSLPYCGPKGRSNIEGSKRIRHVRSLRFESPTTETFDEFLIGHLKYTLGKSWGRSQIKLSRKKQHAIIQWLIDLCKEQHRILGDNHNPSMVVAAKPTGTVLELLAIADDIYRLSLANQLPDKMLKRLRKHESFQGARYELALAASFVRAGFKIQWLSEARNKHAEFVASSPQTGDELIVEAKSRHRPGVLHQTGIPPDFDQVKLGIDKLYREALKKSTNGKPFLISIDVNLPQSINAANSQEKWLSDLKQLLDRHPEPSQRSPAKEFCLVLTNFNWHYAGSSYAPPHQVVYIFPSWTHNVPDDERTYVALIQALDAYGRRPEGIH